jgi:hypothetical protein
MRERAPAIVERLRSIQQTVRPQIAFELLDILEMNRLDTE